MHRRTRLAHLGRDPARDHGLVNTPVGRTSTVVFDNLAALRAATARPLDGIFYGRFGTQNRLDLQAAIADLDGTQAAVAVPSGLAACVLAIVSQVSAGDRVLLPDNVYWPTRKTCDDALTALGIRTVYYDPLDLDALATHLREPTRMVYLESPGSVTFEVADVPAICALARQAGAVTAIDNTWATPLGLDAAGLGVDLIVHAATKYIVGHSDAMVGLVSGSGEVIARVQRTAMAFGYSVSPDDCALALRGLRTLGVRLDAHLASALAVCEWLAGRDEVAEILFPPWPGSAGHDLWRRDFTGGCGLLGVRLQADLDDTALGRVVDPMRLFALGYSWGGYESLVLPVSPRGLRSATRWEAPGTLLRLHIGLEAVDDLISDLNDALARLPAA